MAISGSPLHSPVSDGTRRKAYCTAGPSGPTTTPDTELVGTYRIVRSTPLRSSPDASAIGSAADAFSAPGKYVVAYARQRPAPSATTALDSPPVCTRNRLSALPDMPPLPAPTPMLITCEVIERFCLVSFVGGTGVTGTDEEV